MIQHLLLKNIYPLLIGFCLVSLTFLTIQSVQAAPPIRPLQTDIVVTTTIQAAINAASPGDTVIIPAGTYTESLTLSKAVSLTGVSSATTIIHALSNQRVLTITGATINNSVVISGVTVTGGNLDSGLGGGGIFITNNAQPLLQNMIIANNRASNGGGILVDFGIPVSLVNLRVISIPQSPNPGENFSGDLY
jgi:pectin methylesterase-like acyl-CoA thioesterase